MIGSSARRTEVRISPRIAWRKLAPSASCASIAARSRTTPPSSESSASDSAVQHVAQHDAGQRDGIARVVPGLRPDRRGQRQDRGQEGGEGNRRSARPRSCRSGRAAAPAAPPPRARQSPPSPAPQPAWPAARRARTPAQHEADQHQLHHHARRRPGELACAGRAAAPATARRRARSAPRRSHRSSGVSRIGVMPATRRRFSMRRCRRAEPRGLRPGCASPSRSWCRRRAVAQQLFHQRGCPGPARRSARRAAAPASCSASARISARRWRSPVESCTTGASSRSGASASRGAMRAREPQRLAAEVFGDPLVPPAWLGSAVDDLPPPRRRRQRSDARARRANTSPSFGSRSAIMRRNRLLPEPDGPVIARHSPARQLQIERAGQSGCAGRRCAAARRSAARRSAQAHPPANFASSRTCERMP